MARQASVGGDVAATEAQAHWPQWLTALALLGPGVAGDALAERAPVQAQVASTLLVYEDAQPGQPRMHVVAPVVSVQLPLGAQWSMDGSAVADSISGASPAYHDQRIEPVDDFRRAYTFSATHYGDAGTQTLGVSDSEESDYQSRGLHGSASWSTPGRNTTYTLGAAISQDRVHDASSGRLWGHKWVRDWRLGVTQVWSPVDVLQLTLGLSSTHGYQSDPYKLDDQRPTRRHAQSLHAAWNHRDLTHQITWRQSARLYRDDWGVVSLTLDAEQVFELTPSAQFTLGWRYYSQTAADFYVPASGVSSPFLPAPPAGALWHSWDQRLSAFGSLGLRLKWTLRLDEDVDLSAKVEVFEQRGSWALRRGSAGLLPLQGRSLQLGMTRRF